MIIADILFKKRSVTGDVYVYLLYSCDYKSIVLKERIKLHQAKKIVRIVLSLPYYSLEKNTIIENYAMLLINSFLCRFTAEEKQINLESVVTVGQVMR